MRYFLVRKNSRAPQQMISTKLTQKKIPYLPQTTLQYLKRIRQLSSTIRNLLNGEHGFKHKIGKHISRDRIITLTDTVLAIVMTSPVLQIVVTFRDCKKIPTDYFGWLPDIWNYETSYIILGFFWIGHDHQFHYLKPAPIKPFYG